MTKLLGIVWIPATGEAVAVYDVRKRSASSMTRGVRVDVFRAIVLLPVAPWSGRSRSRHVAYLVGRRSGVVSWEYLEQLPFTRMDVQSLPNFGVVLRPVISGRTRAVLGGFPHAIRWDGPRIWVRLFR